MSSKSWLALPALAVAGLSWYYYTCHIRCSCSSAAPPLTDNQQTTIMPVDRGAIEFNYHTNFPVTSGKWTSLRDSLIQLAKAGKNIVITGYYSPKEYNNTTFENLGLARADTIKRLLQPDIPLKQILLKSGLREPPADTINTFTATDINAADPVKAPSAEGGVVQQDEKTALIYFPSGSAQKELNKNVDAFLVSLSEKLKSSGGIAVITGHTDNKGKYETNLKLSKARAEQIKTILAGKGVESNKLTAEGKADKEPIGDNNTEEGRRLNRRVEIKIQ